MVTIASTILATLIAINPVSDSGNVNYPVKEEFVRLGTTKQHLVDIDKGSIKVDWEDNRDRLVSTSIRLTPQVPTYLKTPLSEFLVSHYVGKVAVNCSTGFAEVVSARTFGEKNTLLNVDLSGGPLAKWKNFGERPTKELVEIFCVEGEAGTKKRIKRSIMT